MDPQERKRQIEEDSAQLRPALESIWQIQRPPELSGEALKQRLQSLDLSGPETSQDTQKTARILSWRRPLAACAAVFVAVLGAVLVLPRLGVDFTSSGGNASEMAVEEEATVEEALPETALDMPENLQGSSPFAASGRAVFTEAAVPSAKDYDEVLSAMNQLLDASHSTGSLPRLAKSEATDSAASSTNVQVEGVDEGDRIQTDGTYLYYIAPPSAERSQSVLYIIDLHSLSVVSTLEAGDSYSAEIYLNGDQLILVSDATNAFTAQEDTASNGSDESRKISSDSAYQPASCARIYNISDRSSPKLERTFTQEGSYVSSRLQDKTFYLVTSRSSPTLLEATKTGEENTLSLNQAVPRLQDSALGEEENLLPASSILLPEDAQQPSYAILSVLDISQEKQPAATQAILGGVETLYQSQENLYITYTIRPSEQSTSADEAVQTKILKFTYDGSNLSCTAAGTVDGQVQGQFSLHENNGNLYIVTSTNAAGTSSSNLYVLDGSLSQRSALTGLAVGESLHAVRYLDDMAYLVTFQQTDPLFAIDLTDPDSPQVLGQLKTPGFSDYLHPIRENLLLGIGQNTQTAPDGTVSTDGMKLSLFDVSDPTLPIEADTLLLGSDASYSPALYDHKAVLYRESDQLIGFPVEHYGEQEGPSSSYYLFRVVNDKLELLGSLSHPALEGTDGWQPSIQRAAAVGDVLYTASDDQIVATSIDTFETVGNLILP